MNRQQQLSLVVVLGLIGSIPAFAADPSDQGGGWRTSSADAASSTLSGKLYRNSADQSGSVPYIILDRWGVVRGYVATARGVDLESCLGQQVSLQGTIKTLPGGDMPCMTCQRILGGDVDASVPHFQHRSATRRQESVAQDRRQQEIAPQPDLPTRSDMAADPAAPHRGVAVARGRARTPNASRGRRFPEPPQPPDSTSVRSPSFASVGRAVGQLSRRCTPRAYSVG